MLSSRRQRLAVLLPARAKSPRCATDRARLVRRTPSILQPRPAVRRRVLAT
jgi:hypothetical protein